MQVSPQAGKLANQTHLGQYPQTDHGLFHRASRPIDSASSASPSAPRATGGRPWGAASMRTTSWPSARRFANTESSRTSKVPLFIGKDTHALAECGFVTALEVLAANGVT